MLPARCGAGAIGCDIATPHGHAVSADLTSGRIETPEALGAPKAKAHPFTAGDVVWIKAGGEGPFVVAKLGKKKLPTTTGEERTESVVQIVGTDGELADLICDESTSFDGGWILASLVTKDRAACAVDPPPPAPPPAPEDPLDWWEVLQIERPLLCLTFYALRWVCAAAVGVAYFSCGAP